jgi:dipeptidyl aminopeptidase/acylaminoacyl peptidase
LEASETDYQRTLDDIALRWGFIPELLIVHGDADDKVPIESNDQIKKSIQTIVVVGGDHDLQRPDMVKQYLDKAVNFLKK